MTWNKLPVEARREAIRRVLMEEARKTAVKQSRAGIPSAMLEAWSRQGATTTSSATYQAIQNALSSLHAEVYLQGFYGNDTNIYGDSDVDVVVQFTPRQPIRNESLLFDIYRIEVIEALKKHFPKSPINESADKCIKIGKVSGRQGADVIPCLTYHESHRLFDGGQLVTIEGMKFFTRSGREIINFPKNHKYWGSEKHTATGKRYKPTVRIFKHARNKAVEFGFLREKAAPSYFVECLLFNVPDVLFVADKEKLFRGVVEWLTAQTDEQMQTFMCQNRLRCLFNDGPTSWNTGDANLFINALVNLWNKGF